MICLLFVWDGPETEFHSFTEYLYTSDWSLTFSGEINTTVNYLEIILTNEGDKVITKNYFKSVDCNSLLEFQSCHHKKWLTNIPHGQFQRLRRNCTNDKDYVTQSSILKKRFKDKKYPKTIVNEAFIRAGLLSQEHCGKPKSNHDDTNSHTNFQHAFVTVFIEETKRVYGDL